ncbi:MAG: tyrosine-type recombinase/integrase [Bacillota bacterium]
MASIASDANGRKRIQFIGINGQRHAIRLGKASMKQAEAFKVKVEDLVAAAHGTGFIQDETARWLAGLPDLIHSRLAAVGLVKPRNRASMTLKAFLEECFAALVVKSSTSVTYGQTKRCLLEYFGESKPLREIEPADADKWRQWLKTQALAESTIARRVKMARQAFKRAIKWGLILTNPFADVVAGSQSNKARQFFVTREAAQKVIEACPDAQWKLLFALSRYGGLRCPSEHLALKWSDVDWERNRLRVPSCKTEHIEGGDCRMIPLFPELQKYLQDVWDELPEGTQAEYVITRYRDTNANLRTQLCRIIRRAGLEPWPKLFHNLRSTRQTELAEKYPIHVVCAWLGNSRAVAQEHYLQVTDAHFAQAVQEAAKLPGTEGAAQNEAQKPAETARNSSKTQKPKKQNRPVFPGDSATFDTERKLVVTPRGFEPLLPP